MGLEEELHVCVSQVLVKIDGPPWKLPVPSPFLLECREPDSVQIKIDVLGSNEKGF